MSKLLPLLRISCAVAIPLIASNVFAGNFLCRFYYEENNKPATGMTSISSALPKASTNGRLNLRYLPDAMHQELTKQCKSAVLAQYGEQLEGKELIVEAYRSPKSPLGFGAALLSGFAQISTNWLGMDLSMSEPIYSETQIQGMLQMADEGLVNIPADPDEAFPENSKTLGSLGWLSLSDQTSYWAYRISKRTVIDGTDHPGTKDRYFNDIDFPGRQEGEGRIILGAIPVVSKVDPAKNYAKQMLDLVTQPDQLSVLSLVEPFELQVDGWTDTPISKLFWAGRGVNQLHILTPDFSPVSVENLDVAADYIRDQIAAGRTVYVHCKAGRGRSAMAVIAYLHKYRGMEMDAAMAYVKGIRRRVNMNLDQKAGLMAFMAHLGQMDEGGAKA